MIDGPAAPFESADTEKSSILENALDGVVGVDENNRVIFWNKHAETIFGWSRAEILGADMTEMIVPVPLRERHRAGMRRFVQTGVPHIMNQRIEVPGVRKNGEEFPMELTVSSVKSSSGFRFYSFMRDITERTRLLNEVRDSEVRASFLAQASGLLSSSLDAEKILKDLSDLAVPQIADWCSIRMIDSVGEFRQVVVSHKDPSKVKWGWELQKRFPPDPTVRQGPYEVLRTGQPEMIREITDAMLAAGMKNKEQRELTSSIGFRSYICVPIRTRDSVIGTLTLVTTDESGRRYSEKDLKLAEELGVRASVAIENARLYVEAKTVNRMKDEFLATLSHELRTPMNVIQGHAEILEVEHDTMKTADRLSSIQAIKRNALAQGSIIADLLDVSSIITGKVTFKPSRIVPCDTLEEIVEGLQPNAQSKGIALAFERDGIPGAVVTDPTRLHQIVWNLISNAIKFTDGGGKVTVSVTTDRKEWSVIVTDTGKGIDPKFLPFVFDRFRQEDATTTRRHGGLGLGLSIVRHLVDLHGGRVKAESDGLNKGARFTVTLPLEWADAAIGDGMDAASVPVEKVRSTARLDGLNILLVDDSGDNRELIRRMLARAGAKVVAAESAADAREKLRAFKPDLIVSDIGMPDEDGIEFMRKIRSGQGSNELRSVPAVALTAYVREEERTAVLNAGFRAHVGKPVSATSLIDAIQNVLRH